MECIFFFAFRYTGKLEIKSDQKEGKRLWRCVVSSTGVLLLEQSNIHIFPAADAEPGFQGQFDSIDLPQEGPGPLRCEYKFGSHVDASSRAMHHFSNVQVTMGRKGYFSRLHPPGHANAYIKGGVTPTDSVVTAATVHGQPVY